MSAMGESAGSSDQLTQHRGADRAQEGASTGVRTYFVNSQGATSTDGAADISGSFLSTAELDGHGGGRTDKGRRDPRGAVLEGQDIDSAAVKVHYSQSIIEGGMQSSGLMTGPEANVMLGDVGPPADASAASRFSKTILERGQEM